MILSDVCQISLFENHVIKKTLLEIRISTGGSCSGVLFQARPGNTSFFELKILFMRIIFMRHQIIVHVTFEDTKLLCLPLIVLPTTSLNRASSMMGISCLLLLVLTIIVNFREALASSDSANVSHKIQLRSSPKSIESNCFRRHGYSLCFDNLQPSDSAINDSNQSLYNLFMVEKDFYEGADEIGFKTLNSCETSAKKSFQLIDSESNRDLDIILIRPNCCKSLGNIMGFFYEMVSFGLANGYVIGRLDPKNESGCNFDTPGIESYLPRLIIPDKLATSELTVQKCKTLSIWPWQNPNSYFWNAVQELDFINTKLIQDYSIANIPEYRDNPTILDGSVAIHYRCGDSLGHRHYGVYPFRIYKKILEEISENSKIVRITIFSDAKKDGTEFGEICWNLLGELQQTILSMDIMKNVQFEMQFSSPIYSIYMLHLSTFVICAVSTFCFYGSFGSKTVYLPGPINLIGYPTVKGLITFGERKIFQADLLRPANFPDMNTTEFTEAVKLF